MPSILMDDDAYDLLEAAVSLHRSQISGGFLTTLGDRFLLEVFRNIADSDHGVALLAVQEDTANRVQGFLFGATSTSALYRDFVLRHGVKALLLAAPHLVHLSTLRKAWETLMYPVRKPPFPAPQAELLDLAVTDSVKGTGLAQTLFRSFVEELERRGYSAFKVTTGAQLARAQRFYEKMGAVRVGVVEIHAQEPTVVYAYGDGFTE